MVLHNGQEHPTLCWCMDVKIIIHPLSADHEVLPSWKRILVLTVTHCSFAATCKEEVIRLVDEDIQSTQVFVELRLLLRLAVDRILKAAMVRVVRR